MEDTDFGVPVEDMDVDQEQVLARSYGVRGVPTVILVDATGKALKRFSGVKSQDDIKDWLGDIYT